MKKRKNPYNPLSNTLYVLKDIYIHQRGLFLAIAVSSLCGCGTRLLGIYLPKTVVDISQAPPPLGEAALKLGGFFALLTILSAVSSRMNASQMGAFYDLRMMYMRRIVTKSMRQSYSRLESEEGQSCYWKARDVVLNGDISWMVEQIVELATNILGFLSFSAVISMLNPFIVLFLVGMSAVTFIFMKRGSRIWESVRGERAVINKQSYILAEDGKDPVKGKDIRLYTMKSLFTDKMRRLDLLSSKLYRKQRMGYIQEHFITMLLDLIRDGGAYIYLIARTVSGSIDAGEFVLYFGAIASFSSWLGSLTWKIDTLRRNFNDVRYLREFMEYEDPVIENPEKIGEDLPEIEFKNVSFSYDGKTDVLKNFNLKIRPGEHIALIGINGAGKSTIVKLLCGFYAPTKGSVTIGGAEASRILPEELFEKISAVFQEMCILPHTLAENISMRELSQTDSARAAKSLEKAGLGKFRKNLSMRLTRAISDKGTELSGGEAQKLMTARAIYKDAPILILDEPTAALDPIAESETYEKFHEVSRGKTALYISHRLAGTRFCDRIVFLDGGEAKEIGSHEELLAKGGGYAKMFDLQSQYYKNPHSEKDGEEK